MLIKLTGTPGTGKHTIARLLAQRLGFSVLDLNSIFKKRNRNRKTELTVSIDELNRISKPFLSDEMIVVSHLAHLVKYRGKSSCIVIRCDPLKLARRLRKRGYSQQKIYDNVMFEALDGTYIEALEANRRVYQVDNSNTINGTVHKLQLIVTGKGRGDLKVDYSSRIPLLEHRFKTN